MEAKELRIGNIIYHCKSIFKSPVRINHFLGESMANVDTPYKAYATDYEIDAELSQCEGILLDDPIVKRLLLPAFELNKRAEINESFKYQITFDDVMYNFESDHDIRYLHELQNIIYYLSQKELMPLIK